MMDPDVRNFEMRNHGTKSMWRWWCGGGVSAIAVVLGCASAVEFKDSGREAGTKTASQATTEKLTAQGTTVSLTAQPVVKRGLAADRGHEHPHNGGKATMPVTASFDGDMVANINRETTLIVAITAESDISSIRGSIEGIGGLKNRVGQRLTFTELGSGETKSIEVRVPAVSGSLAVTIEGLVNGSPMATTLELKVNPKAISASSVQPGGVTATQAGDMGQAPAKDGTGQVVQPMKARED